MNNGTFSLFLKQEVNNIDRQNNLPRQHEQHLLGN